MSKTTPHSIELKVTQQLPRDIAGEWARCVIHCAPSGLPATAAVMIGSEEVSSAFYCVHGKTGYHYVVPLARDLTEDEADAIANHWHQDFPDMDFVINWSQAVVNEQRLAQANADILHSISEAAAKRYHGEWYNQKVSENWSFGHRLDGKSRKHPMLQPWEQLPSAYRVNEVKRFKTLLSVLESMDLRIAYRA